MATTVCHRCRNQGGTGGTSPPPPPPRQLFWAAHTYIMIHMHMQLLLRAPPPPPKRKQFPMPTYYHMTMFTCQTFLVPYMASILNTVKPLNKERVGSYNDLYVPYSEVVL